MTWSVYGKLLTISSKNLTYQYDAAGNRISKTASSTNTWYVRDAQGNVMSVYSGTGSTMSLQEQELYGSSRLGMIGNATAIAGTAQYLDNLGSGTIYTFTRGKKLFELSNHLGNVLATISDKKFGSPVSGAPSQAYYYTADVKTAQDYYPGGMLQPGRTFTTTSSYQYGFNGQEKSDEISGTGNHNTAEFWEYDTRSVRRWNLDPKPTIGISEYSAFNNNPIWFSDPFGDTLSNPQLVDALKMASREIKNRLKNKQGFYTDDAKANLNRGVADYLIKNNLSMGDASDFQKATQGYYNGLGTIAMMSSNEFNNIDAQIINNKNLNSKNTIVAADYYMQHASKNLWSFMGSATDAALLPATTGLLPDVGSGPRGPMINSGTQQAIVKAGSARVDNILTAAARGNGNFGLGTASYNQAMNAGRAWVGPNYRVASDGSTLVSENGLRTFRPPSFKPKLNKSQANFEWWQNTRSGKPAGNGHLDVKN